MMLSLLAGLPPLVAAPVSLAMLVAFVLLCALLHPPRTLPRTLPPPAAQRRDPLACPVCGSRGPECSLLRQEHHGQPVEVHCAQARPRVRR